LVVLERAGEGLGRQVGAQLRITRSPPQVAEHRGRVPAVELRERLGVGSSSEEQGLVRDRSSIIHERAVVL
jgi:hypothetical protein